MKSFYVCLVLAVTALGVSVPASAQPLPDSGWSRVKEIDRGKEIRVVTRGSLPASRIFLEATDLELLVRDGNALQKFARADVKEVGVKTVNARRVVATLLGGFSGFFLGGWFGGMLENNIAPCNCDDPGLKGALIGMPAGAAAGAIIGHQLVRDPAYKTVYRM